MSRQIADNLSYLGKKFIDARGHIPMVADFATLSENYYPDGFMVYCQEDCSYYRFDEFAQEIHPVTGKWQKIGSIATHAQVLEAGDRPEIFTRFRYKITTGGTLPADALKGDYVTVDEAAVPFVVDDLRVTEANQVIHFDGANWRVCHLPNENEIHIFQIRATKYTEPENIMQGSSTIIPGGKSYPCNVVGKYELAPKLTAAGWEFITDMGSGLGAGIKFCRVMGYKRGGSYANLGTRVYYANPAQAGSITIAPDKVTIPGDGDYLYTDITVDTIKQWESEGRINPKTLDSCAFETDLSGYICHIKTDKSFDNLANFEETRSSLQQAPLSAVIKENLDMIYSYEGVVETETGPICHIQIYGKDKACAIGDITGTFTPSGWTFDSEGFWSKIFPADLELDVNSETAVANGVVTRAINEVGHKVKLVYESDCKVLTSILLDKFDNEISRVAVNIGSESESANPKVKLDARYKLFKAGEPSDVRFELNIEKGTDNLKKVELVNLTTGDVALTLDETTDPAIDPEAATQTLYPQINSVSETTEFKAIVYDEHDLQGESKIIKIKFVPECLYNPDGSLAEEDFIGELSEDGCAEYEFKFNDGETSQAIIKIPVEIMNDCPQPIITILGGKTRGHLYTDYQESFDMEMDAEGKYFVIKLIDACNLNRYIFKPVRAEE